MSAGEDDTRFATGSGGGFAAGSSLSDRRLELAEDAFRLKDEPRGGWVLRGVRDAESVADHSWGTAFLCLLYGEEAGIDRDGAVTMALVHDLAEAVTGDVVARADASDRTVSEVAKAALESAAMDRLVPPGVEGLRSAWQAYEDRSDATALFVRDMNLVDMCLQAVIYHEQSRYDADVVVPSKGGYTHLDEFFASARERLSTPLGRRLFAALETRYLASR